MPFNIDLNHRDIRDGESVEGVHLNVDPVLGGLAMYGGIKRRTGR